MNSINEWERQVAAWNAAHNNWQPFHEPYHYLPTIDVIQQSVRKIISDQMWVDWDRTFFALLNSRSST